MDLQDTGRTDIITGSISGRIHWFRCKPNRAYAPGETLRDRESFFVNVGSASAVAVADWEGDGDPDLLIGNGDGGVFLIPNEGTRKRPLFGKPKRIRADGKPVVALGGRASPFVADWDGDGRQDLILGSNSGQVSVYRNIAPSGAPELAAPIVLVEAVPKGYDKDSQPKKNPARSAYCTRACVADWNGDKRPDLIVGDFATTGERGGRSSHGWVWVYLRRDSANVAAAP